MVEDEMRRIYASLCLLLTLLLWSGCTYTTPTATLPTNEIQPTASLTPTEEWLVTIPGITEPSANPPCQGPQWTGITFRKTTEAELVEWLNTSTMVDQVSLGDTWYERVYAPSVHYYFWALRQSDVPEAAGFNVLGEVVYSFQTPVLYPLQLEQVVAWWGEPSYVTAHLSCRNPEECRYLYEVGYSELGMMVSGWFYQSHLNEAVERDPDTGKRYGPWRGSFPVTDINCGAAGDVGTLIENTYVINDREMVETISERFHPWTGWGQVELFVD